MKNGKKDTKGIYIKSWEEYDFILLKDRSGNGKNILYYYFLNPQTGKKTRVRISKGIIGNFTDKVLMTNARILADAAIYNLKGGNFNPITRVSSNAPIITPNTSIIDCTNNWLTYRLKMKETGAIGQSRIEASQIIVKHFNEWLIEESYQFRKPGTFTEIDIDYFLNKKTKEHKWSKETYNCYRDNIKSFFIYLIKLKVIIDNPVTGTVRKNTKNDSKMYKIYEEDELKKVLRLLTESKEYFILLLSAKILYRYSIRLEEQLKLKIQDYDIEKRQLTLSPEITKNKNEAIFHIDDETHEMLLSVFKDYPKDYFIFGGRCKPSAKRLKDGFFGQKWRKFRDLHKLSKSLKFYAIKHTSAFFALQDGETIAQLMERLRHTKESTTRRYSENTLKIKVISGVKSSRF